MKPNAPSQGRWNAYVAAGRTREERAARLGECASEAPGCVQGARSHVETVFRLRGWVPKLSRDAVLKRLEAMKGAVAGVGPATAGTQHAIEERIA